LVVLVIAIIIVAFALLILFKKKIPN
jgi:hypothetical protein